MNHPFALPLLPLLLAQSLSTTPVSMTLNTERFGMPALSMGGYVYVAGGHSDRSLRGDFERIDPLRGSVEVLPHQVIPRYFHMGAVRGQRLILLGGVSQEYGRVEEFNPFKGTIRELPPMPEPVARAAAFVHEDRLYVVGGSLPVGRRVGYVQIYDFKKKTWSRGADMPVAREGSAAIKDGLIYAPGGYDGQTALTAFQVYDIARDEWRRRPDLPVKLSAHSTVIHGDRLYTFGDYERLDRVAACDLTTDEWFLLDLPYLSSRHNAAVVHGHEVLVIGGNLSSRAPFLNDIQRFRLSGLAAAPRTPWTAEAEAARPMVARVIEPRPRARPEAQPQREETPAAPVGRPELSMFHLTGKPAPDFELPLLNGETFRLSDHTGRVVVLDFWASWCAPCEKSLPHMARLAEALREQDVTFLGISRDRSADEDKVRAMAERHKLPYPVGLDLQGLAMDYAVGGIPCVVLIDRNGLVTGRQVGFWDNGPAILRKDIELLLAGLPLLLTEALKERAPAEPETSRGSFRPSGRGRHAEPDARYFKPLWTAGLEDAPFARHGHQRLDVLVTPRHYTYLTGQEVRALEVSGGATSTVLRLPDGAAETNEMGHLPQAVFLENPAGGLVVMGQTLYHVTQTSDTGRSFRPRLSRITAVDAKGVARWSHDFEENAILQQLATLPAGPGRDILLATTWNNLMVYDEEGRLLMDQSIGYEDRWTIFQSEPGAPLRVIVRGGESIRAYEWVFPEAP